MASCEVVSIIEAGMNRQINWVQSSSFLKTHTTQISSRVQIKSTKDWTT
jgi:hypothetical protein